MNEEKSEKMLEAEAKNLSAIENTYRGLCSDIAKWRKRGVKKYKKEILAAVAELDAFEGEKWVRLGVAQKIVDEKDREIRRLGGYLNQAKELLDKLELYMENELHASLKIEFDEIQEVLKGSSGSGGGAK